MPLADDSEEESVYEATQKQPFTPFDPEAVQPTSTSPAPSTQSGDVGDTSGEDGDAGSDQAQDPEEPLPEFDPRYREEFVGLMYLGSLSKTFSRWGHEFVIRTLTTEEIAEIGLLVKEYDGTLASTAVYQAAVVAAAVVSVDGRPIAEPLEYGDSGMRAKYRHVAKKWMPPVRAALYQEYFDLEITSNAVLEAMGKVSG